MRKRTHIIGLTGGIGMGKSTVASQLERLGAKICNADDIVHQLLAKGGAAVQVIGKRFPDVVVDGRINRQRLGDIVFRDKEKLQWLESVLHPLVQQAENRFIERESRKGARLIVLDIPLLFETGGESRCDMTLLVTAPPFIQRMRVMQRKGMTLEKFHRIVKSQMPDRDKRKLADIIIPTGLGKARSFQSVAHVVRDLHDT